MNGAKNDHSEITFHFQEVISVTSGSVPEIFPATLEYHLFFSSAFM